jgi:hypothetical protein
MLGKMRTMLRVHDRERRIEDGSKSRRYRFPQHSAGCGALEKFVNQGLVGLGFFCGQAAEAREQRWGDADSDELLRFPGLGATDATGALQFRI